MRRRLRCERDEPLCGASVPARAHASPLALGRGAGGACRRPLAAVQTGVESPRQAYDTGGGMNRGRIVPLVLLAMAVALGASAGAGASGQGAQHVDLSSRAAINTYLRAL